MRRQAAGGARVWWVVVAMAVAVLPLPIDSFGLVVALPSIGARFSATTATLAWVLNGAMLAFGAGVMVLGRLSDVFGRRRMVLYAMAVLGAGSMGCALAPSMGVLIAFRVLEGAGMAGVYAASFPIVNHAFPPARRAMGLGLWAGGFMLGTVIGPPLAGWLVQHLSWRWIFWINVPLLAVALALTLFAVEESRDEGASRRLDWFGIVVPTVGVFCLLFALQSASGLGWGSPAVIATLVAGPLLLVLFVVVEPRRPEPLIDFGLFTSRAYWSAAGVAFAGNVAFAAILFLTPLYLQVALGYTPLGAGTVLLAVSVPCFVLSVLAGPACSRFGTRLPMMVGMVSLTIATAAFATVDPGSGLGLVVPVLIVTGIGLAGAFNGSNIAGVAAVPEAKAGAGSGVLSQVRLVGQTFG
ncbi:MAG TPA: MFS transporter, partial [Acidimicrobiales bacterium]|nr:MFS transporter [Acidimicrobiales bacterium]